MEYLYLWLNIGSFSVPFLFSFHPKLKFYKKWKSFAIGTFFMMAFFISWDVIFTNNAIWGFNDNYITGYKILNLPIEEWLFFICIPYACIFSHYSLSFLIKNWGFSKKTTSIFYVILVCALIITLWYAYDKWYTFINFTYAIILLGLVYNYKPHVLERFLPTFLIMMFPFLIINGILTGTGIEDQVVWYDNSENLGIRILTVPVEDSIYALGMLLTVLVIMDHLESKEKALR